MIESPAPMRRRISVELMSTPSISTTLFRIARIRSLWITPSNDERSSASAPGLLLPYEGSMEYRGLILFFDGLKEGIAPGP